MIKELETRKLEPLLKMSSGEEVTPNLWHMRRLELLDILQKYCYGYTPAAPKKVLGTVQSEDINTYAGKVIQRKINISFDTPGGEFAFPIHMFIPKGKPKAPVFLNLAFRRSLPDRYLPIEEITDNGFALAVVCYHDITPDSLHGDYDSGLAAKFVNGARKSHEWGKIGMWAYGASRVLDYLESVDEIDAKLVSVIGHSRLGKTALWCAAQDERFFAAISNNSGFGGAALAKCGEGERVIDFINAGSWDWFCESFKNYVGLEDDKPYDQHFLLALVAPRYLCIGSAVLDKGADPKSEFLGAVAASEVWELLGHRGFVTPDEIPSPNIILHDGNIGYHIREGTHFFSRYDWNCYMKFIKEKIKN